MDSKRQFLGLLLDDFTDMYWRAKLLRFAVILVLEIKFLVGGRYDFYDRQRIVRDNADGYFRTLDQFLNEHVLIFPECCVYSFHVCKRRIAYDERIDAGTAEVRFEDIRFLSYVGRLVQFGVYQGAKSHRDAESADRFFV